MSDYVIYIKGQEQFAKEVLDFDGIVIVDFYADWCMPCRMLGPIMEEVGADFADNPKVKVVKVNVDDNMELAQAFGITGIPAVFVFAKGQVVKNLVGLLPKTSYVELVESLLEELDNLGNNGNSGESTEEATNKVIEENDNENEEVNEEVNEEE